ncbi:MAG: NAD(P)H-hydrate dehydratase [Bacillaceae bacterium]
MRIGTVNMTQQIDHHCEKIIKMPLLLLMEHAALALLKHMDMEKNNYYTIVCGYGNNGGDGFALARLLHGNGKHVSVFTIGREGSRFSECAETNFSILQNMGISIVDIKTIEQLEMLSGCIQQSDITVDGIFGTGLKAGVQGLAGIVIDTINKNSKTIVSIDVPSGMNGDDGATKGAVVNATKTVCFEVYKRGFFTYEAQPYLGEVVVEKIGVPTFVLDQYDNREFITSLQYMQFQLKEKQKLGYKSNFGHVTIIAGSEGFEGAAYLSTEAAVKCGSGLVTLATSKQVQSKVVPKLSEAMNINRDDVSLFQRQLEKSEAIAFGPGMGNTEETLLRLQTVFEHATCPIVIDADGINVIANVLQRDSHYLQQKKQALIFTPHLGEMARLTGLSIEEIRKNRLDIAKEFAKKHGVVLLLKGYQTIITDGDTLFVNPTGNSAMANGGMGDTLTGIITSFIGQGLSPLQSAVCGAYLHGYIGDELAKTYYTINGTDIISQLQQTMKVLSNPIK